MGNKCPECKQPAYIGFTAVECPTKGCKYYSKKQEEIIKGINSNLTIKYDGEFGHPSS